MAKACKNSTLSLIVGPKLKAMSFKMWQINLQTLLQAVIKVFCKLDLLSIFT